MHYCTFVIIGAKGDPDAVVAGALPDLTAAPETTVTPQAMAATGTDGGGDILDTPKEKVQRRQIASSCQQNASSTAAKRGKKLRIVANGPTIASG